MKTQKKPTVDVNGVLLLDKCLGLTSNAMLQRVKHLFSAKKAGHTGSLDPLATGMLPICFGEATKFSQFLLDSDKRYQVVVKLGIKTNTGDAEGYIIETKPVENITLERITSVANEFIGLIQQVPPMFSAIKHQGKPLYELARKGIEIDRQPRQVHIYYLQCYHLQENVFHFEVHCSKGTYVRTLAEDIGERLGCGAHVIGLRRSAVLPYNQAKMMTFPELEVLVNQSGAQSLYQLLLPIESSVQSLPEVKLSTAAIFYIRTGQPIMTPNLPAQGLVRIFSEESRFIGVGEVTEDGRLAPKRLIAA